MTEPNSPQPTRNQNVVYLAAFASIGGMLLMRALDTGAFSQPSTYVGIVVGAAIALAVWAIARRKS